MIGDAAVAAVVDALAPSSTGSAGRRWPGAGTAWSTSRWSPAEQAARLGSWGVIASVQPNFDALWGGDDGMYAQRLGVDRARGLNPLALLASQGVPLAFGSDSPVTGMNPWATVRAATTHHTPGSAVSARAAFAAATRGAWRAGGVRDGVTGTLVPGAPASYAIWDADEPRRRRPRRRGAALVHRSALPGAGAAAAATRRLPAVPRRRCTAGAVDPWLMPRRIRAAADTAERRTATGRASRRGPNRFACRAVVDRLPALSVTIVAGLLLCVSFPPFGWWYAAIVAFALLGWVLTRESTTLAAGSGTVCCSGWPSTCRCCRGSAGWSGRCPGSLSAAARRCSRRCSALLAVLVRRLPGWPLWFAGAVVGQEWLKSTVPFGGFPWGVVGFAQTEGPLLPLA